MRHASGAVRLEADDLLGDHGRMIARGGRRRRSADGGEGEKTEQSGQRGGETKGDSETTGRHGDNRETTRQQGDSETKGDS